jgi:PKD repeat protein
MTGDRTWGVTPLGINVSWSPGPSCYETVFQNVSAYDGTPPYTYLWDFGDGTTSTVQNPTHVFPSGATYQVTVTARDVNLHMGTRIISITPQSGNTAPVSDFTVTAYGWTVTLTDLSYDPDYNTCGHSGPGSIEILWGDMYGGNPRTTEAINLTNAPSNKTYTHTYSTVAKITANIYENIRDNAGTLKTKSRAINIPTTYTVGGRVTRANGTGLSGAIVYFRTMSGANPPFGTSAAITDANGYYTISGTAVDGVCYVVKKPEISGYTFAAGDQTVCAASATVNFTSIQ